MNAISIFSIPTPSWPSGENNADIQGQTKLWYVIATRSQCLERIYSVYTDIQPHVYRKIIDDVIANVGVDFEEYGMDEAVLIALQAVCRRHHFPTAS
jgi:hypothetical protein